MIPELGPIILEQLRIIGGIVDVIHADIGDIKRRVSMVEDHVVGMDAQLSELNARMDRLAVWRERLARAEFRRETAASGQQLLQTHPAAKPRGTPLL